MSEWITIVVQTEGYLLAEHNCAHVTDDHLAQLFKVFHVSSTWTYKHLGKRISRLSNGDFNGMDGMQILNLWGNDQLTELPENIFFGLPKLRQLKVANNSLTALHRSIFSDLTKLKQLYLNGNDLTELPPRIFNGLTELELLNLHNNNLERLAGPGVTDLTGGLFVDLTKLLNLDLGNNNLFAMHEDTFSSLTRLRKLYLNDNSLTALLPEGIFSSLTKLEELNLNGNGLTSLPGGIFSDLTKLEELNLKDNGLTSLPGGGIFSDLTALKSLSLKGNGLTSLPGGIFSGLTKLQKLYLSGNGLRALPGGIFSGLTKLQKLYLDGNGLTALPGGIFSGLTKLQELYLNGNGLTALPGGIFSGLTKLQELYLNGNGLTALPGDIFSDLTALETLDLSGNPGSEGFRPIANAGADQVAVAGQVVTLNATVSEDDPWGDNVSYVWTQTDNDGGNLTLRRANTASPRFVMPAGTTNFKFKLKVTGRGGDQYVGIDRLKVWASVPPDLSVCDRTPQVRDAIVALVPVSDCADVAKGHLAGIDALDLSRSSIVTLQEGDFADLTNLYNLALNDNNLTALPEDIFASLTDLTLLYLGNNSLDVLPGGVFADLTALETLELNGNPGSEGFRPIANAGSDQTARAGQRVTLRAKVNEDNPWGDNVSYVWTQTDNSDRVSLYWDRLTLSSHFYMPEDATVLEFELRVTGRGGNRFGDTDRMKVRSRDGLVTLTGPEPAATTDIVGNLFSLVFTYSAEDGRVLAGNIEVTAAIDGVAIIPDINIDEASGQGEITVVLRREKYPGPIEHLLAVTLSLSATAEGFVLGEPNSITTPFSFFSSVDPSVCARTPQVRDAIVALVPVSHCAYVTDGELAGIGALNLSRRSIVTLQEGDFAGLTNLSQLLLSNNSLAALPAGVFSGLPALLFLNLNDNSLEALPAGVFSGLPALRFLYLDGNPGSEGFRPIADAGADQTAVTAQVVTLTATASGDDPWGDNVRYLWTRTDNGGSDLTLMDAETANPNFVMPASSATGLEFELRVTGRGGDHFIGTDSLKVRHPDAVVTLTGPEPAAPTTEIVENEFSLVFSYSAADLYGRVLAGNIEVTAAVDGVAVTSDINIDEARGQGEITVVLRRQEYPGPIGHLLAVTLSLSAAAEGFVLGEPSSITTPFRFFSSVDPSVCARTEQVRDAIVASVPVSHCADVTDVHLADLGALNLSRRSIETLQEGDFAGLTNLSQLLLSKNSLAALPAGVFFGLPALLFLNLNDNSLEALPAGVFSGLPSLRFLYLDGNPGSEGFRPIADAGADQTAVAAQVVILTATASGDDPWGDNVRYVWTRTDNSGSELTLMDAETASPSFVMPAGATGLEFELRVTGRGGDNFVGTDSLKVRHPDAVVTLAGPEPAATTTNVVEDSINLVYTYTYSAADLHGRVLVLAGNIEVTAAVDGVAVTPDINIDEARGQGEIAVVLRRQEYPGPIGHLLAVTLSLSAAAEGFVLGEPSSITTPFSFFSSVDPSVCARTEQVRDAIVALVPVSHCADVTDVDLADIRALNLSRRSIVTLQEGDFAGLTNLSLLLLMNNSLEALPAGVFSGLPALGFLNLSNNSLEALPAGVFSSLPALDFLYLDGNPGSEGFRPIANAGADQTAVAAQVVTLTATASGADPWGDNVRYVWTRTDNSGSDLTLMDAETASLSFVMPAGATGLEFELRVTGRGGDHFVGTDSLKVRLPDAVVTLTWPEPAATTDIRNSRINLVYTYSAADLRGRVLAGKIEVAAAIDGVAITPDINIDEASGQGEITVVLRRQDYPGPIGHLLAVTLSLSAGGAAEGFVLGEPSSMTTTFSFFSSVDPSVCARTEQVRDAILALVPVIRCPVVTDVHLADIGVLDLSGSSIETLQEGDFAGLTNLSRLELNNNSLEALPAGVFSGLPSLRFLYLAGNNLTELPLGVFAGLPLEELYLDNNNLTELPLGVFAGLPLEELYLDNNNLTELPLGVFAGLTDLYTLYLNDNDLMELSADVFSGLPRLGSLNLRHNSLTALPGGVFSGLTALIFLHLNHNSLTALPGGVFSGLTTLDFLYLDGNPGSKGFRPIADAGADQTAVAAQVVKLRATASDDDPWGDNVRYVWTRTDNSGSDLTLRRASTASPSFVMPAGATELEFELRVTGRGGDNFVGIDSLKVLHRDAVVTLTGPEPAATTTEVVENEFSLVFTYSAADLYGRVLAGKIEVTAAVDGVAVTRTINIDEASGQGEITVVLRRQEYPGPIGHLLAVTLSLSAGGAAEGFVLGEPSSITTPFSFFSSVDPSVCARTEQVRDAIVALVAVSHCADVTDVHLAGIGVLNLSQRSIVTLQEDDFAGLTNLSRLQLSNNSLAALPAGVFSGLTALGSLDLHSNSLTELPLGVFSELPALRFLYLDDNSLTALPAGVFSGLTDLETLLLNNNNLMELSADVFSGLPALNTLALSNNSLRALPAGVFSGLTDLWTLELNGNPGSEGFRPIADAGADQTAVVGQVVTLTATASDDDPWGDNVRYVWTRTDNSGSELTLMDAETASPSFVMPAGATGLEFKLRVTGRGGDHSGTDRLKVRHPDAVVTLTGPEPAITTTEIVENEFSLVFIYSAADLSGRVLAGKIEVAVAIDGVAITPTINIDEASGQGEITVVLRRQDYPNPDGHLLAVTLSLSAVAEGFVLGEPSSITTTFRFSSSVGPSVCARTEQVRDAIVASVPVSHCADVTDVHLADIGVLILSWSSIVTLQEGDFAGLPALVLLDLSNNSLEALPAGVFSGLPTLRVLYLDGNPGSEGFRPIADAGADQTAVAAQVVILTATASGDDPWGDNVRYVWTRTDNSGSELTLMDAETASPSFVMPAGATELEFELRVTGRGGDPFVGTDSLKVRHPDPNAVVVTLTGPEPAATTTNIVEDSINLVYTYSAADLHGRVLAGNIEVTAAVDGVAVTPDINIDEARGQGEITVVLRRQEYPGPIEHLLAVTLSLSAAAEGFVLGEPSSMTTNFSFFSSVDPSVCARTEQVRDAIVASVPVSHCADVTDVHLAGIGALNLSWRSIVALQEGDFAGLTNLSLLLLNNNSLEALPAGVFSGLPALGFLNLNDNSLEALPAGVFSGLPSLRFLYLDDNPGSEGFRPIADAGADQTAGADQVVTLTATVSADDPWGDNVRYVWTRIDNSGSDLTLMDAETASPSFVMPAGATGLEFELRVTGRGGAHFVGTDSLKVRHPDSNAVVVTLTGPEPAATTTNVVEDSINLVYTYSVAGLHGRVLVLAGNIEVTAAVDGVAVTPTINIDEASGQGEITVVLRRQEYPGPIGHLLAVTLSLSAGAAAEGFVLGEPSSITTPFSFRAVDGH